MGKQARTRYAKGGTSSAFARTENTRKDRGLNINEGPADVVFEAPTQGTKPTGIFKTNIEVLAEFVRMSFSKDAHVAAKALRDGEETIIPKTEDLRDGASFMEQVIWKEQYLAEQSQIKNWKANNAAIFNLLLQHCTPALKAKLQGQPGYAIIKDTQDDIALR